MYDNLPFSGRKTSSFYLNLITQIILEDPTAITKMNLDSDTMKQIEKTATVDMWMYRAFGYDRESGGNDIDGKYGFVENEMFRIRDRFNAKLKKTDEPWTAYHVQAAIWTALKARTEDPEVKAKTWAESIQAGYAFLDEHGVKNTKKDIDSDIMHRRIWHKHAMMLPHTQALKNIDEWAADFSTFIEAATSVVTWEAIPSTKLNHEIGAASQSTKRNFTNSARMLLMNDDGSDALAERLGVGMAFIGQGSGAYAGGVTPNSLSHLINLKDNGEFLQDNTRAYAQAVQYVFKQDAVPWFRADPRAVVSKASQKNQLFRVVNAATGSMVQKSAVPTLAEATAIAEAQGSGYEVRGGKYARGLVVQFTTDLTQKKEDDVLSALQNYLGEDAGFTKTASDEITIINFRDDETHVPFVDDEVFFANAQRFVSENAGTLGIRDQKSIYAEGEYGYVHNWGTDKEGESILNQGSLAGRPDLHPWLRDRRKEFEALLGYYSGQTLTKREERAAEDSERDNSPGGWSRNEWGVPVNSDGTVSLVHWSKTEGMTELDPIHHGKGIPGAESKRKKNDKGTWTDRTYYGLEHGGYRKEPGLGVHRYTVREPLKNLYDFAGDPENFFEEAKAIKAQDPFVNEVNVYESLIKKAGYKGYWTNSNMGFVAAIFEKRKIDSYQLQPEPGVVLMQKGEEAVTSATPEELPMYRRKVYDSLVENGKITPVTAAEAMQVIGDIPGVDSSKYMVRTDAPPKKTVKAYKLFRVKKNAPGQLFPLFVDAKTPVPMGQWLDAEEGERTATGKVKSKLGPLAYRPGWHAGDLPIATHIGSSRTADGKPAYRPGDQVWAEIEVAADVDWQTVADSRATISKKTGKPVAKTAHITDQVPVDGHYRYKTNPNMKGEWIISGAMNVKRILSDKEVAEINKKAGVRDLPRREGAFDSGKYGFETVKFMTAWHGSPADHNKFSLDYIGAGEGKFQGTEGKTKYAGMFGYGLYFAGEREVAEYYRSNLSEYSVLLDGEKWEGGDQSVVMPHHKSPEDLALSVIVSVGGIDEAFEFMYGFTNDMGDPPDSPFVTQAYIDARDWLADNQERIEVKRGHLYEVELAPEEDQMLDWFLPLDKQSAKVQEALEPLRRRWFWEKNITGMEIYNEFSGRKFRDLASIVTPRGFVWKQGIESGKSFVVHKLVDEATDEVVASGSMRGEALEKAEFNQAIIASEFLKSLGVRGIKYSDQASRWMTGNDKTYNYVIFDDNDISIVAKYAKEGQVPWGFTTQDGKVFIIPENIPQGELWSVMRHEVGTHIGKLLQKNKEFIRIQDSLVQRQHDQSSTGAAIRAAMARIPKDTPAEYYNEELLAYLVSNSKEIGIVRRIIAIVKNLLSRIGLPYKFFNEKDLMALADMAIRREARNTYAENRVTETMKMVAPERAKETNVKVSLPTSDIFLNAVENTKSAEITEDGLLIDIQRFQKEDQAGAQAIRTGVFYLPQGSKDARHYKGGKLGYGGDVLQSGKTLIRNPIFVKGATGGKAPEAAYDQLKGKGAYEAMRSDLLESTQSYRRRPSESEVAGFLQNYGADDNLAYEIIRSSKVGNTLHYAIQENIVAHAVREAGHDAVVGYSKRRDGTFFISEIFDVRETTYPDISVPTDIHPDFEQEARYMAGPSPLAGSVPAPLSFLARMKQKYEFDRRFESLATYLWNQDQAIERVQNEIGPQPIQRDHATLRSLIGKRAAAAIKTFDKETLQPLLEHMARNKQQIADVEELAYGQHAPERNLQMRRINARRYADAYMAWMTDKEKEIYTDRLYDIQEDFVMQNQTRNQKRDNLVDLMNDMTLAIPNQRAEISRLQTELDNRIFTAEEVNKGTPDFLQGRLDKKLERWEKRKEIAERWDKVKDKLSGITDSEAADIVQKWAGNTTLQQSVEMLRKINEEALDMLYQAGDLTEDEYNAIKNTYKFHVPLYREDQEDKKQATGKPGVGPLGKPYQPAVGSTRKVTDVFAHIIDRYQAAISRSLKLEAGRALYDMVNEIPDENRWSIAEMDRAPYYDSEGNIRFYPDQNIDDKTQTYVKVDGKKYIIEVPKDNPGMLRWMAALNRQVTELGPILQLSGTITRVLARLNTSWNPEFALPNFVRDLQAAMINMSSTEARGMQREVFKNVGKAIKGIYRSERGKPGGPWAAIYKDAAAHGVVMGWMHSYDDVKQLSQRIQKELEIKEGKHPVQENFMKAAQLIDALNLSVENGVRVATYKALIDKGMDKKKAASVAANLTVDFTRRGTAGPVMNSLYMFWNAGVQGNVRVMKALITSPKVRKIAGGIVTFGAIVNLLGYMMAGDDDDGENHFDKLRRMNPALFERNMIFMIPDSDGDYIKIPMSYGYNLFFVLGNELMSAARGKDTVGAMARIATTAMNSFNPMASATLLQTVMPTLGDPLAQVRENKAWHGGNLMPADNPFANEPDSERYFKSVGEIPKSVARWLNDATGGTPHKEGKISVSPETLEMVYETFSGGAGKLVKDVLGLPASMFSSEPIHVRNVPLLRKVFGTRQEGMENGVYFENRKEMDIFIQELKVATPAERRAMIKDPLYSLVGVYQGIEKTLNILTKQRKVLEERGRDTETTEKRIAELKNRFNTKYNEKTNR
jgi:hypothetical protein